MGGNIESVKAQILVALQHIEAEEGLYLRNFNLLHEEDDRDPVLAEREEILVALNELVAEGRVRLDESGEEVIFHHVADV